MIRDQGLGNWGLGFRVREAAVGFFSAWAFGLGVLKCCELRVLVV